MEKKIRCLKPEEIEIRVQQITEKGAQLLLYKDSRCDKRILDETFGIFGWKDRYEEIKGNYIGEIFINSNSKNNLKFNFENIEYLKMIVSLVVITIILIIILIIIIKYQKKHNK